MEGGREGKNQKTKTINRRQGIKILWDDQKKSVPATFIYKGRKDR